MNTTTDDVVASGRRQRSRRRWGMAGIATVTLIAAGLVAAATVGLPHFADADDIPATQAPAADGAVDPDPSDLAGYALVVRDLFHEQNSDLEYNGDYGSEPFELSEGDFSGMEDTEVPHMGAAFLRNADDVAVGSVSVLLYEPGSWSDEVGDDRFAMGGDGGPTMKDRPIVSCWSGTDTVNDENADGSFTERNHVTTTDCEETTTADGDRVVRIHKEEGYEGEDIDTMSNTVVIYRTDGTAVVVQNFCGSSDEDDEYGGTCHDLQFDLDQIEAIATQLPPVIVTDDGH